MEQAEIWKDIPGFEGRYRASNCGRIKSVDRVQKTARGVRHLNGNPRDNRVVNLAYMYQVSENAISSIKHKRTFWWLKEAIT
ncbi:NUMOD4 domain-containing protein [Schleiferilactobacillus perolens]|uniref:NUMOD4 domain-containing protein n=1 Tax=Schleiferilactobacillus perolens TaxID=100468 RepID=UPI0009FABEDB|nr:NUMOD4 domain-containing protein [Schleiferilactobacillus perolens]